MVFNQYLQGLALYMLYDIWSSVGVKMGGI